MAILSREVINNDCGKYNSRPLAFIVFQYP